MVGCTTGEAFKTKKIGQNKANDPVTHKDKGKNYTHSSTQRQGLERPRWRGTRQRNKSQRLSKFHFISVLGTKVEFEGDGKEKPTRQDISTACPSALSSRAGQGFSGKAFVVNKTLEQREMKISRQVKRTVTDAPGHRPFSATEQGKKRNKIKIISIYQMG